MPTRPPGPFLLDFPYVQTGQAHHLTINVDMVGDETIGISPTVATLRSKGAGPLILSGAANAFWAIMRLFMPSSTIANSFVLWKYNGTNLDKTFISGGTLTTPNGGSIGTAVLASQLIMSYRSGGGNLGKLVVNDTVITTNVYGPLGGGLIGETVAVRSYLLSDDCVVMARDRSFPVAGLNEAAGQNEKLWKRRYRP